MTEQEQEQGMTPEQAEMLQDFLDDLQSARHDSDEPEIITEEMVERDLKNFEMFIDELQSREPHDVPHFIASQIIGLVLGGQKGQEMALLALMVCYGECEGDKDKTLAKMREHGMKIVGQPNAPEEHEIKVEDNRITIQPSSGREPHIHYKEKEQEL